VRDAPRRYRLPDGMLAGTEGALALAIEAARLGEGSAAAFVAPLSELIVKAMAPVGGDAAFQALVLRASEPEVDEYVRLMARRSADERDVRATVNAVAHPAKTGGVQGELHRWAQAGEWGALLRVAGHPRPQHRHPGPPTRHPREGGDPELPSSSQGALDPRLREDGGADALSRLARADALRATPVVQRYLSLLAQLGPAAGTDAALAQGLSSARAGAASEQATIAAFRQIAGLLDHHAGTTCHWAIQGLRTPPAFPGPAKKAKGEWDAAILCNHRIVLLAEVKAAPAAAVPDYARLLRGLERLAGADADQDYVFLADGDEEVTISGASLQRLRPSGRELPPHVIYCCSAPPEAAPALLSAATRGVLLAEPASVAYAWQLAQGATPPASDLLPVWQALTTAPHLNSALHQLATARQAREAMLHPDDLLASVATVLDMQAGAASPR
jgi:hypothetical protein